MALKDKESFDGIYVFSCDIIFLRLKMLKEAQRKRWWICGFKGVSGWEHTSFLFRKSLYVVSFCLIHLVNWSVHLIFGIPRVVHSSENDVRMRRKNGVHSLWVICVWWMEWRNFEWITGKIIFEKCRLLMKNFPHISSYSSI